MEKLLNRVHMSNTYPVEKLNNVEWKDINWRKVERYVFKLQKRIFQASSHSNCQLVRTLQRTLTRSYYARLLATRKVTQDNSGKRTAGVDGVKFLSPRQRLTLAQELSLKQKPLPARRILIPKAKGENRPLSSRVKHLCLVPGDVSAGGDELRP